MSVHRRKSGRCLDEYGLDRKGADKMKRKTVYFAALTMSVAVLTAGCSIGGKNIRITTGLSDSDLFKIDGSKFSVSDALMYLTTEKNVYEESFGTDIWDKSIGDTTFENYVKDSVKDRCARIKTLNLLAKEKKLQLSEAEKEKAANASQKYFSALSEEEKTYLGVTDADVTKAYEEYLLANKVYEEIVKDINPEISDADAKVIRVQSIYQKTYMMDNEGNRIEYTQEEKQEAKKNIDGALEQIKNGSDFVEIATKNTDAGQIEYQFGKGEMIEEFEKVAFALKEGEVSDVIETPDGYYIIKCISDYLAEETQKNKEAMVLKAKNEAFRQVYDPFVNELSSEFNDKAWEKIRLADMTNIKVDDFFACIEN